MIQIPGYHIAREVRSTSSSRVLFGTRNRDGLGVVFKLYREAEANRPPSRARHEYETLNRLNAPGIVSAVGLESLDGQDVLVMERFPGGALREHIADRGPLELDTFLDVALGITQSLAYVHGARIVHGDLKPGNILIDPTSLETCLIDFGLSRELGQVRRLGPPSSMCGSLRYLSPEQTGRTRHGVDFRSDLYSLGIVFYSLLTGKLPFEGKTAIALIHAHIGVIPTPPVELRPELPTAISNVVMKLLEKEPDARYQSAYGLARDLETCRSQLGSRTGIDAELRLGEHDALERLRFSDRVVGKRSEIEALAHAFEQARAGKVELASITGPIGIGKSALCSVLHAHATSLGAYVGRCKFEADRTRVPYVGLAGVLGSLIEQILVESSERFDLWRDTLRQNLGRVGGALLSLAPDLALIVDDFPALVPLGPAQARDRLMLAVRRFFHAFGDSGASTLLIFDDLQWADEGSLDLLRGLLSDERQHHLLVVLASRLELEEDQATPRARASEALEKSAGTRLCIAPLSASEANAMVADVLGEDPARTQELAELIGVKTCRNPLQMQRTLEVMWERGALRYHHGEGWKWNLDQLASYELTPDSAVWMAEKLRLLPAPERELLTVASIQPGAFDLDALLSVAGRDRGELLQSLIGLVEAGILLPCREGFKFSHDRVREAAQCLMSSEQRGRLHFQAGRRLLDVASDPRVPTRIFVTAEHLRRGHEYVPEDLRVRVLGVHLQAGKQALSEGAAVQASDFLIAGSELFRPEDWEQRRDMGFDLYLHFATAATQLDQFTRAHSILNDLEARQPSRLVHAHICAQRIRVLGLTQSPEVCARYSLEVLSQLGAQWPLEPSRLRVQLACLRLRWILRGRSSSELFPKPSEHVDQDLIAILIVLNACGHVLSRIGVRLALLASTFAIGKFARAGCLRSPGYSLAAQAVAEHALFGSADRLRAKAQLVEDWMERMPDPFYGAGARLQLSAQIWPWLVARRIALAPMAEIAESFGEVGSREGLYYTQFLDTYYRVLAGDPVELAHQRLSEFATRIEAAGHEYPEPAGAALVIGHLIDSHFDDASTGSVLAQLDAWLREHPGHVDIPTRTLMLMTLCVHQRYALAFEQSEAVHDRLFRVLPNVHVADHTLFRGIAAAELARERGRYRGLRYLWATERCIRRMRRWAQGGPDFLHMLLLLRAKRSEALGHFRRADLMLARAAELARKQGFPNHLALALEFRARLLGRQNRLVASEGALREALEAYEVWGVRSKINELRTSLRQHGGS